MKIGLLGCGTVGSGVYEILGSNNNAHTKDIEIIKIAVKDESEIVMDNMTTNADEILDSDEIDLVVEVIGGINPAYNFIMKALNSGKHVVSANKAVIAKHLKEFTEAAAKNNVEFLYEASAGGGIPVIKGLRQAKRIDEINCIFGILNGTTNFILHNMYENDYEFDNILRLAQAKGYAEANPGSDIDGIDVRNKIMILSSLGYNTIVDIETINTSGIRNITKHDIDYFKKKKMIVKLYGQSVRKDDSYCVCVEPVILSEWDIDAGVNDNFNIVSITGTTIGELRFFGQGAGKLPTANAVVQDIIDINNGESGNYKVNLENPMKYDGSLINGRYYIRINSQENKFISEARNIIGNHTEEEFNFKEYDIFITSVLNQDEIKKLQDRLMKLDETIFMARYI